MNGAGLSYLLSLLQRLEEDVEVDFQCDSCRHRTSAVVRARANRRRLLTENALIVAESARCPSCGAVDRSKRRSALGKDRAQAFIGPVLLAVIALVFREPIFTWVMLGLAAVVFLLEYQRGGWCWADVDARVQFGKARRGGKKSKTRGLRLAFVWGDALDEAHVTWPLEVQALKLGLLKVDEGETRLGEEDELGKVDADTARSQALAQLKRSRQDGLQEVHPGVFSGHWEDELAASRILVPELFRKLKVNGDPIAFTASEDTLVVAGSEDPQALKQAFALSKADLERVLADSESSAGRFTATPWVLKPSGFQPWSPSAELLAEIRELQQKLGPSGYRASGA